MLLLSSLSLAATLAATALPATPALDTTPKAPVTQSAKLTLDSVNAKKYMAVLEKIKQKIGNDKARDSQFKKVIEEFNRDTQLKSLGAISEVDSIIKKESGWSPEQFLQLTEVVLQSNLLISIERQIKEQAKPSAENADSASNEILNEETIGSIMAMTGLPMDVVATPETIAAFRPYTQKLKDYKLFPDAKIDLQQGGSDE